MTFAVPVCFSFLSTPRTASLDVVLKWCARRKRLARRESPATVTN